MGVVACRKEGRDYWETQQGLRETLVWMEEGGSVAIDLSDMTYEETVLRMVRLMFVLHEKQWVDNSLRNLTGDWLRCVEERFAGVNREGVKSLLQNFSSLNNPLPFVKCFFDAYLLAAKQLLAAEDTAYFLAISQRPGQKPVPFIPVLDASFEVWFKKVSSDISNFHLLIDVDDFRIPCGMQKMLRPSLIKILSACVSFKVP